MASRKIPLPITIRDRPATELAGAAPTSPLERNLMSPRGWKNRDSTGVGLGIVATLNQPSAAVAGLGFPVTTAARKRVSAPMSITAAAKAAAVQDAGIFTTASPAAAGIPVFPASSFLDSCYLCRKRLHGKDIYIYRGENAFCSPDCRNQQILSDEVKENCRSRSSAAAAPASVAVSGSSPYADDRLFFTGIATA